MHSFVDRYCEVAMAIKGRGNQLLVVNLAKVNKQSKTCHLMIPMRSTMKCNTFRTSDSACVIHWLTIKT